MSRLRLPFNAIETKYHGYKFRSRLEARWAVFFDTLGVEYQYELEGYVLEKTRYLPDFYLPQQDCFVEIKGQHPTPEEIEKARLLALYTCKNVYTLSGDLWLPDEPTSYKTYLYTPPIIYTYPEGSDLEEEHMHVVDAPQVIKVILQRLYDQHIMIDVRYGLVTLHSMHTFHQHEYSVANYLTLLQKQCHEIEQILPLLQAHSADIIRSLTPKSDWRCEFYGQVLNSDFAWAQCSTCGDIALIPKLGNRTKPEGTKHKRCSSTKQGTHVYNSPQLTEAYNMARQARF